MTTLHQLQPPDAVGRLPVVLLEPGEEAHQLVQLSIRLKRAHGVHLKDKKNNSPEYEVQLFSWRGVAQW